MWKTLNPSKIKAHDFYVENLEPIQGNTLCYKVTHVTSLLLDLVTHHAQRHLDKCTLPSQDKLHDTPSKVSLDLDTLNSLV